MYRLKNGLIYSTQYLFLFLFLSFTSTINAQNYADGTGRGSLQRSIFWLTWTNGLTSQPASSDSTLVTAGVYTWEFTPGVKVIATVSNINPISPNSALRPYTTGKYYSDGLNLLYPGIKGAGLKDSLYASTIKFDISVDLQLLINGSWKSIPYPGLVVGDAESMATDSAAGIVEYIKATALDANASWQLLDLRKESYSQKPQHYQVTIGNNGKDFKINLLKWDIDNFMQAVMYAKNARSLVNVQTQGRGYTAVAIGLVAPFDFGDAPSSFGNAGSYMANVSYNTPPLLVDSVYTAINMPKITITPFTKLYMGTNNTDADGNPPHSATATIDNVTQSNDEDGFNLSNQPGIYVNNANNLIFNVTATNKQSTPATIYAWVDFDGNGQFSTNEFTSANVPVGDSASTIKLVFDYGKFGKLLKQGPTYARFRITTTKLLDNPNTLTVDDRSTSIALDGETEDYKLNDITFGNINLPSGVDDLDSTLIGIPVTTSVKDNDTINAYYSSVNIASLPNSGVTLVNANGTVTYMPKPGFTGIDTYTYTLTTPAGLVSLPINVTIFVKPVGVNDYDSTPINTPFIYNIKANDGTAEVNNAVNIISLPDSGSVQLNPDGTVTYTPNKNFVGIDSFKYVLTTPDGISSSPIIALVKVVPLGVNDVDSTLINNSVTTIVKVNDGLGAVNDTVKVAIKPTNGKAITNTNGTVTYMPTNGFTGKDTYVYTLTDSTGKVSHPILVTIFVKPVGVLDRDTTTINTPVIIDVKINDSAKGINNNVLINTQPTNGFVSVNGNGTVTYTPNNGYIGKDTFYYNLVTLDSVKSASIPVYMTVLPAPKQADVQIIKVLNTTGVLTVGETINFLIVIKNNGTDTATNVIARDTLSTLLSTASNIIYAVGNATFNNATKALIWKIASVAPTQSDTLTFNTTINSGTTLNNIAFVSAKEFDPDTTNNHAAIPSVAITIAPVGVNDLDSTFINTPVTTNVKANDGLINLNDTIKIVNNPTHGSVVVHTDGTITYTPTNNYTGKDTYTYTLTNAIGAISKPITATIYVKPVGVPDRDTTLKNTPITIDVKTNDSAKAVNNSVLISSIPNNGTATLNTDGTITYKPNNGFVGKDTCYYTLQTTDGIQSTTIPVYITVQAPPKKADVSIIKALTTSGTLTVGETVNFLITVTNKGTDIATGVVVVDTLAINLGAATNITTTVGNAVYNAANNTLIWTIGSLAVNQTLSISFSTLINSGKLLTNSAIVSAIEPDPDTTNNHSSITPVIINIPIPVGVNDNDSTPINTPVTTIVKANDGFNNTNDTVKIVAQPTNGTVKVNTDGSVVYTPVNNYIGNDNYTYTLTTAAGGVSAPIKVSIIVKPTGVNDVDSTEQNTTVTTSIKRNDGASAFNTIPVVATPPTNGIVVINANGTATYTPKTGFIGTDTYTYTLVTTDSISSAPITVTIIVKPATIKITDLSITKDLLTTAPLTVGSNLTFSISVTNNGPNDATGVVVMDTLAKNLDVPTNFSVLNGFTAYNATNKIITWTIGSLAANNKATLTFNTVVDSGTIVNNAASVAGNETDPDVSNNRAATTPASVFNGKIFIPNVITPNGDGKNDKFVIVGLGDYPNSELSIFNRWDNLIYHSSNYANNWDGNGFSTGTYYYVLKLKLSTGASEIRKGWVLLTK